MSRATRIGGLALIVGAFVDLIYHGLIQPFIPLPELQQTLVSYAGHIITFIGMIVMLIGVAWEAWRGPRKASAASPDSVSLRRE